MMFRVPGIPRPQGSKTHIGNGRMIEKSKYVAQWRRDVAAVAKSARAANFELMTFPLAGPVSVMLTFYMPRPVTLPRGRTEPTVRPDIDKLGRAVLDALTLAGIYSDDAQVTMLAMHKTYATPASPPGVAVSIHDLSAGGAAGPVVLMDALASQERRTA